MMCAMPMAGASAEGIDLGISFDSFRAFGQSATQQAAPRNALPTSLMWSDESEQALDAYRSGDYAAALEVWEVEAEAGDLVAQYYLATMYRLGRGVRKEPAMALRYFGMAASQFQPDRTHVDEFSMTREAMFWVAYYNSVGDEQAGIERRPAVAFRLFTITANHGHPGGQFYMGVMFLTGEGTTQDPKQGMRWLHLAAEKGHAPAMARLGEIFWSGEAQLQDRARGLMWYMLAIDNAIENENPEIFDRAEEMLLDANDDERQVAQGLAVQWAQSNH